jgi:hypothetical protein
LIGKRPNIVSFSSKVIHTNPNFLTIVENTIVEWQRQSTRAWPASAGSLAHAADCLGT